MLLWVDRMHGQTGDAGIGRRVRASRDRLGLTREKLAARSRISLSAIAQVESGRRASPRPTTLSALAGALGVSIDYLVDGAPAATAMAEHLALVYDSDEAFAEAVAAFLREGVERSEAALSVTTKRKAEVLRRRLGDAAQGVRFEDSRNWLRDPESALELYREFVIERLEEGASWVRVVGEPRLSGRSAAAVGQWIRLESMFNVAFAAMPLSFLCAYDERRLDAAVIEQAHNTHPTVLAAGAATDSLTYRDPIGFAIDP